LFIFILYLNVKNNSAVNGKGEGREVGGEGRGEGREGEGGRGGKGGGEGRERFTNTYVVVL
jgi:hypothetical protein